VDEFGSNDMNRVRPTQKRLSGYFGNVWASRCSRMARSSSSTRAQLEVLMGVELRGAAGL
jgi:hypothetical protein